MFFLVFSFLTPYNNAQIVNVDKLENYFNANKIRVNGLTHFMCKQFPLM